MPRINNENENHLPNEKTRYIDRASYDWAREQRGKDNKEIFVNATIVIAAAAIYATWMWMIVQKIKA